MAYDTNALYNALAWVMENDRLVYHKARANRKLVNAPAFNTLPLVTCAECCMGTCGADGCYALKNALCHGYNVEKNNCLRAWAENTAMVIYRTAEYFENVRKDVARFEKKCAKRGLECFVRVHASGDFYSKKVFNEWLQVAREFPAVHFMAFTKQFAFIHGAEVPANFSLILSAWEGMEIPADLTARFPVAYVDAGENCVECCGSCENCKACWMLQTLNKNVRFHKH